MCTLNLKNIKIHIYMHCLDGNVYGLIKYKHIKYTKYFKFGFGATKYLIELI